MYQAKRRELEAIQRKHSKIYREDAAPLMQALAEAGLGVDSLEELNLKSIDYRARLPIILEWLPRISNKSVRKTIIGSLARKEAKPDAAPVLIKEFLKEPPPKDKSDDMRVSTGVPLEVVADDSVFDEMVNIAKDRSYGVDRAGFVRGLKNMRNPAAIPVLIDQLDDESVAWFAMSALRLLGATEARSAIEPFLTHEQTYIRNEAKKTIAKFDKIEARKAKTR